MNKFMRRAASFVLAGAVIVGGLSVAQAANAEAVAGNISLYAAGGTAGTPITSGSATANPMFWGITIDQACPAGYQNGSQTYVFQGGTSRGGLSTARTTSISNLFGDTGLQGTTPVNMSELNNDGIKNNYVANKALSGLTTPLSPGVFELRYYCHAVSTAEPNFTTDKYFVLELELSPDSTTWSVYSAPVTENTTVSLTAAAQPDDTVVLTGTVKDEANVTATAAVGTVEFYSYPANVLVGSGAVAVGVGTFTTGVLSPGTYQFTAKFVSGDTVYGDSPLSGNATVSIEGDLIGFSTILVEIPAGIGALTLSGVPATVDLDTAVLAGGVLTASGTASGITVSDTRQLDAADWSLTGQVGNFSNGTHTLLGKYLGWAPTKVSGPGVAGASVAPAPGTTDGLSVAKTLGTGAVTDGAPTTVFDVLLNLAAPANTPAGDYSATLTITLA